MKLSIRDLLFVTTLAALVVAWWIDHRRHTVAIEELKAEVQKRHYYLTFDDKISLSTSLAPDPNPPKK